MSAELSALAALLVAGHALGDFVLQSDKMIRRKKRFPGLLAHGGLVAVCHTLTLLPFFGGAAALTVVGIAVSHLLIDAGKTALTHRAPSRGLEWFTLDQLVHLAVLVIAWRWLGARAEIVEAVRLSPSTLTTTGILISAYAFNIGGMSGVVVSVFSRLRIAPDDVGPSIGRVIGILERLFTLTLVLLDHWEALGFLVAAKALARFKALDDREHAEYYLVGTLVSLFGASLAGLLARVLLARL